MALYDRRLVLVLVVSFVVKGVLAFAVRDLEPQGDQCAFHYAARSVLNGTGFQYDTEDWDEGHTPPLYVLFLAGSLLITGGSLTGVRIVQALVATATVALVFRITDSWLGRRGALVAATITAFLPEYLVYFQFLYSETWFTFLLTAMALAALRARQRQGLRDMALLGLLLGLTALTRSMIVYLAPVLVLWVVANRLRSRRSLALVGMAALTMAITIAPWTVYNQSRFDRFLLLATNAGNVLHRNLNFTPVENYDHRAYELTDWKLDRPPRRRCAEENPVDRYRCELRAAAAFVLENPARTVRYAWIKLRALWNPTSFLVRYLYAGHYGDVDRAWILALTVLSAGSTVAVVLLGTLGFAGGPRHPVRSLILLLFLYWSLVHAVAFGMSRYRVPLLAFLVVGSAGFLGRRHACWRVAVQRRENLGILPWLVLLASSWALYVPVLFGPRG